MASISFPSDIPSSSSSSSSHHEQYYSSQFDTSASFTMNPLSAHPPRTPRPSMIASQAQVYGNPIYEPKPEVSKEEVEDDASEVDEENEKAIQAAKRVRKEHVWREMVLTSNGRDKAFKIIQYSIRVYLLFHTSTRRPLRRLTRPSWELEFIKRLESAASGFSFTRKMLLLFNWLTPLTTIMASQSSSLSSRNATTSKAPKTFFEAALQAPPPVLLDLVNSVADDVATLGLMGVLGKRTGEKAAQFANWCWLLSTLVGLVENGVERQMIGSLQHEVESRMYAESMNGATNKSKGTLSKIDEKELGRLRKQDYWLQVTRAKLAMDLIFVCYDLFKIKRWNKFVKVFAGFASAILSSAKLYDKHKNTLLKAASVNLS